MRDIIGRLETISVEILKSVMISKILTCREFARLLDNHDTYKIILKASNLHEIELVQEGW